MKMTETILKAILTRMTNTGGPFDPAALFLGAALSIVDKGVNTAQSDVTAPTGDSATRVAVDAWSAIYRLDDGRYATDGPVCTFAQGSGDDDETLQYVFFNTAATAGTLKAFTALIPPVTVTDGGAPLAVVPRITVDPNGNWSADVVWDG